LRYLVEHADRLVTQDEILEALWPETYVNPEVIKKYILGIRKVLGDRHDKPDFIRTFPRRGYQFVAPVNGVGAVGSSILCVSGAKETSIREARLDQLGGSVGRALMSQQRLVCAGGEPGTGKATIVDGNPKSIASRPAILIFVVADAEAIQVCRRQT
jgi:hypothetical protein